MPSLFDPPFDDEPEAAAEVPVETPAPAGARVVFSVSELTASIREHLESEFFEVWVEGEISNCKLRNGLAYFTLKDTTSQLRVVMFRTAVARLRFALEDGAHVMARGRVTVYEPRGEYQLVCEFVEPRGLGALQLAFEQLKKKLAAAGLFDAGRKRPLPVLPRKIGIVTSLDGAALRDIVRVISDRHANVHLVIRAARVQGEGAAADIARGLAALARVPGVEVIIAGRGGGSLEDLWAFNDEALARAIAACPIPVISAVGHEVDWTIADFVADVRAATPSNAAEIVITRSDEFCARIDRVLERLRAGMHRTVERRRARVHALTSRRGLAAVPLRMASRARRVDELRVSLERAMRQSAAGSRREINDLRSRLESIDPVKRVGELRARCLVGDARLAAAMSRVIDRSGRNLATLVARLDSLSPLGVLARGYALCWSADGRTLIREATPALEGTQVSVTLARGRLLCDVRRAEPPEPLEPPESTSGSRGSGRSVL